MIYYNYKLIRINTKVNLKNKIIHPFTKENISNGIILNIKHKFNPFIKTKFIVLLYDGIIEGNNQITPYIKEFVLEDLKL